MSGDLKETTVMEEDDEEIDIELPTSIPTRRRRSKVPQLRIPSPLEEIRLSCLRGNLSAVKDLIQEGTSSANEKFDDGWTPLMVAANGAHPSVVEYLLLNGADPNYTREDGFSALMVTLTSPQKVEDQIHDCVTLLVNSGADINVQSDGGLSPLMLAIRDHRSMSLVNLLISKGASPNSKDADGKTPLVLAVERGLEELTGKLLEAGAECNIRWRGKTMSQLAKAKGYLKIAEVVRAAERIKRYSEVESLSPTANEGQQISSVLSKTTISADEVPTKTPIATTNITKTNKLATSTKKESEPEIQTATKEKSLLIGEKKSTLLKKKPLSKLETKKDTPGPIKPSSKDISDTDRALEASSVPAEKVASASPDKSTLPPHGEDKEDTIVTLSKAPITPEGCTTVQPKKLEAKVKNTPKNEDRLPTESAAKASKPSLNPPAIEDNSASHTSTKKSPPESKKLETRTKEKQIVKGSGDESQVFDEEKKLEIPIKKSSKETPGANKGTPTNDRLATDTDGSVITQNKTAKIDDLQTNATSVTPKDISKSLKAKSTKANASITAPMSSVSNNDIDKAAITVDKSKVSTNLQSNEHAIKVQEKSLPNKDLENSMMSKSNTPTKVNIAQPLKELTSAKQTIVMNSTSENPKPKTTSPFETLESKSMSKNETTQIVATEDILLPTTISDLITSQVQNKNIAPEKEPEKNISQKLPVGTTIFNNKWNNEDVPDSNFQSLVSTTPAVLKETNLPDSVVILPPEEPSKKPSLSPPVVSSTVDITPNSKEVSRKRSVDIEKPAEKKHEGDASRTGMLLKLGIAFGLAVTLAVVYYARVILK